MKQASLEFARTTYCRTLLNDIVPFWLQNALDVDNGGYYNCLDRDGSIYATDKSMLLICRGIWTFSRLFNTVEKKQEWLAAAALGYEFLARHLDKTKDAPALVVTRDGRALTRMFFSVEAYAVMACSEYASAAQDDEARERAQRLFRRLVGLYETQGVSQADWVPEERCGKELVVPILLFGAARELRKIAEDDTCEDAVERALSDLTTQFLDPSMNMLCETVTLQGGRLSGPEGATFIPGHSLHAAWGLMEEGLVRGDDAIIEHGLGLLSGACEHGWDEEFGGFLNVVNGGGVPPTQLDWDMKMWWTHNEALYATLLAYRVTGLDKYLEWHDRVRCYTYDRFPDAEYGEWYGYLHRDGTVAVAAKGTLWKGFFHIASSMLQCLHVLDELAANGKEPP